MTTLVEYECVTSCNCIKVPHNLVREYVRMLSPPKKQQKLHMQKQPKQKKTTLGQRKTCFWSLVQCQCIIIIFFLREEIKNVNNYAGGVNTKQTIKKIVSGPFLPSLHLWVSGGGGGEKNI